MNKYQNGKIYKLVCDNSPLVYYGSTYRKLFDRLASHKYNKSCCSRELFEKGNVSIHLIENYPCNSRKELEAREGIYIKFILKNFDYKIICNKQIPSRTKEEYRLDNTAIANERSKEWLKNNKEKRKAYTQIKITCDCGSTYNKAGKSQHFKTNKHIKYVEQL